MSGKNETLTTEKALDFFLKKFKEINNWISALKILSLFHIILPKFSKGNDILKVGFIKPYFPNINYSKNVDKSSFFFFFNFKFFHLESYIHFCLMEKYFDYICLYFKHYLEIQEFLKAEINISTFKPTSNKNQLDFINKNLPLNLPILKKFLELIKAIFFVKFYLKIPSIIYWA